MTKAKIRWTVELDYPLWDGEIDLERVKVYLEEIHCHENILDYLHSQSKEGVCKLCSKGHIKFLELIHE